MAGAHAPSMHLQRNVRLRLGLKRRHYQSRAALYVSSSLCVFITWPKLAWFHSQIVAGVNNPGPPPTGPPGQAVIPPTRYASVNISNTVFQDNSQPDVSCHARMQTLVSSSRHTIGSCTPYHMLGSRNPLCLHAHRWL